MAAPRIVPAFDEIEDGEACLDLRAEAVPIEELALERREETLAQRVVVRVADAAHRRSNARLRTALAEGDRCVLAALVGVMNHVRRPALRHGHVQRGEHQLGVEMRFHRPANHAATPRIDDDGQIQKPGPRRHVRDVGDPQLVRARGREVPFDEIRRRPRRLIADRRAERLATAHPLEASPPHEPRDPLPPNVNSPVRELGMDTGHAIGAARLPVDRLDLRAQLHIRPRTDRQWALAPRVVPAGGDTQDAAHGGDRMDGLVCRHELESLDGIALVSRANQAAAFDRIARASRSWRTSRRSRRSSSRSSVVSPSVRSLASRAACFIQFRIACADGSNWRASSSGVRPLRTSSTIRSRNSGEYGWWLFGIVDLPFRPNDGVSTKPGQLHLSLAIDRELIVKELWKGRGIVPSQPIAKGDNHFDPTLAPLSYNPKEARDRLKRAGYKGEEIVLETTVAYVALDKTMSEAIAAMWKDVGVNVRVEVLEYSVRAQKSRERSFKGLWWGDPTSTLGDPDGMMWRLLGPGGIYDYWRDARFDELGNAARFSVDEKFRGECYREMTKIFLEHLPWLPIIQPYEDYGLQKYVDFTPNPNQQFEIRRFNFKFRRA